METLVGNSNNAFNVPSSRWRWTPATDGVWFSRFLIASGLPPSAQEYLRAFTPRLLGQTCPPTEDGHTTALVIGKVQSGKTNSFLALSALASDNGYRVVVILSGTKNVLKTQTYRQVLNGLTRGNRGWRALDFDSGVNQSQFEEALQTAMTRINPRTLVITVLKRTRSSLGSGRSHSEGIDRLAEFFETSEQNYNFATSPVLIVDDEADEASLDNSANARRHGRAARTTPTNDAIERLRRVFVRHVYAQYTATPQANLLVELTQQLSPDVCELLQPGLGYCGAERFFGVNSNAYMTVPSFDLSQVASGATEPPDSLKEAMRLFYVGSALEELRQDPLSEPPTRSMLVHPSRTVTAHGRAAEWVYSYKRLLSEASEAALVDPNCQLATDLYGEIQDSLNELSRTLGRVDTNPRELVAPMHSRLGDTHIRVVNSQSQLSEEIDWSDASCWIFIGGDVLQRGFAIAGLTITWMPRSAGAGQVDVLMQRGRWFGYREGTFAYCRVWLPSDVHDDYYSLFADHEEALWRSLSSHLETDKSLAEWSRVFWLDPSPALRLCRRSSQWFRLRQQDEWAYQLWVPSEGDGAGIEQAAANARLVDALLREKRWDIPVWRSSKITPAQSHQATSVSLTEAREFLNSYHWFGQDVTDQAVILDALTVLEDQSPTREVRLISMRPARPGHRSLRAGLPVLPNLAQGRGRADLLNAGDAYPGDREFHGGGAGLPQDQDELLTIQIFRPEIRASSGVVTGPAGYLAQGCPLLGVFLPTDIRSYRRQVRLGG